MKQAFVPAETAQGMGLAMPLDPEAWITDRKRRIEEGLARVAAVVKMGIFQNGSIKIGILRVDCLEVDVPEDAGE
jgi:hypothetical protein